MEDAVKTCIAILEITPGMNKQKREVARINMVLWSYKKKPHNDTQWSFSSEILPEQVVGQLISGTLH